MKFKSLVKNLFSNISIKLCLIIMLGCFIQAFGMYNIHSISGVTEGGVLGLLLLLDHWIGLTPAISSVVLNAICFFIGYKSLGKDFIVYSVLAIISFSVFYSIIELFPRIYPEIVNYPLIAAILGGCFIGVGAGLTVRCGAASSGDDAIAMAISSKFHIKIQIVYLASDLAIMALSLTYIPLSRIMYSVLTVIISGQLIGWVSGSNKKENNETKNDNSNQTKDENEIKTEELKENKVESKSKAEQVIETENSNESLIEKNTFVETDNDTESTSNHS